MHIPHPWRRLRELPHITLRWVADLEHVGECRHSTQEIFIRTGLTQAQRRSVVLHEIEHLLEGPSVRGHEDWDERVVTERAARWLIPLDLLADALVWANDDRELAHELNVDLATVRARLSTLTAEESQVLSDRVMAAEVAYPKRA
ncbi:ImmA/IrrE family metallo-endopeptidase [Nocardioides kribbensis]|uniref:ImmA/IrrE family metallo-endopeptidase n=1 Tax=Nocardioides kribbensis TaxID=305517 RepID=UPI001879C75F|nr:ImmA/IrrE family metallo-endopeptidase [Nocardioides kribbensis]